ncbi:MAG TPA: choice-of-anchor D domain-containing protein, partial [Terriglobales bacterium]
LTNTGSTALTVGSVRATPAVFSENDNCAGTVAPGGRCNINVSFTPIATGATSGTLTITDSAADTPQSVALAGMGVASLRVAPSTLNFGSQPLGGGTPQQALDVTNTGTTALNIAAPLTTGDFAVTQNLCTAALAPGATCEIFVAYLPAALGVSQGSLALSDGSGAQTAVAALNGRGVQTGISAAPAVVAFGSSPVGSPSAPQTLTLTNNTTMALTIEGISALGDFGMAGNTCLTQSGGAQALAAGANCVISVAMAATTPGSRTGTLQVFNSANGELDVALSGMGEGAGVALTPPKLFFGSQPIASGGVTTSGQAQMIVVTNTGNAALQLSSLSVQGGFSQTNGCGSSLAAGASCNINVSFAPTALGQWTGTLTLDDNAAGATQQVVSLQGLGSPSGLVLSPAVLNFGGLVVGQTSPPQTVTLANNTGQSVDALVVTASGEYAETNTCGAGLANGASCAIAVTATPLIAGEVTGSISIAAALTSEPFSSTRRSASAADPAPSMLAKIALHGGNQLFPLELDAPVLTFAATGVGLSSAPRTLTVSNRGGTPVAITSIAAAGDFVATNNCPATLASGASCAVTATFAPTAAGTRSGNVTIADSAAVQIVPLSGPGSDFTVALPGGGGPMMTVAAGQLGTANIAFASSAGDNQSLRVSCNMDGTAFYSGSIVCAFHPTTIQVGASGASGTLTITTIAAGMVAPPVGRAPARPLVGWRFAAWSAAVGLLALGALWLGLGEDPRQRWQLLLLAAAMAAAAGCATPGPSPTRPGAYQVRINATSSTGVTHSVVASIQVK